MTPHAYLLLIRQAPARQEDVAWIVSLFTVAGWIVTSLGCGWYATSIPVCSSIFGSLALAIVLLTYVYVSSVVFLPGVQIDGLLRRGWDGGG